MKETETSLSTAIPTVYPADILPMPDSESAIHMDGTQNSVVSDEHALYLSLPQDSAKLFKERELPLAIELTVFHLKADFVVAFLVLQAESLQVRIIIPFLDDKSRTWLEQCVTQSSVTFFIAEQDSSRYRRFDSVLILPDAERVLNNVLQKPSASAFDVLLTISSSLRSIAELTSVPSYIGGVEVAQVDVCIVRDFFNTGACLEAMEELKRPR